MGACAATGATSLRQRQRRQQLHAGHARASGDATCNGVDDNCNGTTDEGYVASIDDLRRRARARGRARPAASAAACRTAARPATPAPSDATCNGVDDNCNGTNDEGYVSDAHELRHRRVRGDRQRTSCVGGSVPQQLQRRDARRRPTRPATASTTTATAPPTKATSRRSPPAASARARARGATSCVGGSVQNSCTAGTPARERHDVQRRRRQLQRSDRRELRGDSDELHKGRLPGARAASVQRRSYDRHLCFYRYVLCGSELFRQRR